MNRILDGIRVLDLTRVLAGPTNARVLAEHGADVLHINGDHLDNVPAFVMDTGLCDNVYALAEGVDLLVIESTFLNEDKSMAEMVGHLTAAQAAAVARESGANLLVLNGPEVFSKWLGESE